MADHTPSAAAKSLDGYVPFPDEAASRYVEAGHWSNRRFHDVLDRDARDHPDRTAVTDPDREVSYRDLAANSKALAEFLVGELDVERLDRVAFQLTNRAEFLEAFLACSRVGAIPVMLLPRHREAEVRHVFDTMGATAYVTVAGKDEQRVSYVDLVEDLRAEYPDLRSCLAVADSEVSLPDDWVRFGDVCADRDPGEYGEERRAAEEAVEPCDPGVLLLSGGTTGLPKGIPRTHNDYIFQWERMADAWGVEEEWVGFPSAPIGHNASLACIVGPALWTGASLACEPELKPEPLLELVEREGGTFSLPIPTQLIDMLEHPDFESYDLSSLEVIISGGQRVPPRVVYEFVDRLGVGFGNIFGMAEGPIITTRPGDDVDDQAHTVGTPLSEADEFRLVDPVDREGAVDAGETGELAARGPGVFRGYFREPEENAENFEDGWFYTEDLLSRREDGYFEVHGRKKDTIIRGGENIYAPGVENALIEHPAVENVAVVGKPDDRLGERPFAFVKLVDGVDTITLEELNEPLEEEGLAVFKRPEGFEIVEEFPRTSVEKISKKDLVERFE